VTIFYPTSFLFYSYLLSFSYQSPVPVGLGKKKVLEQQTALLGLRMAWKKKIQSVGTILLHCLYSDPPLFPYILAAYNFPKFNFYREQQNLNGNSKNLAHIEHSLYMFIFFWVQRTKFNCQTKKNTKTNDKPTNNTTVKIDQINLNEANCLKRGSRKGRTVWHNIFEEVNLWHATFVSRTNQKTV